MFNDYIVRLNDIAANTYHVNPVIFSVIYLLSIPFFYLSFYFVVKELVAIQKEHGKITPQHFVEGRKLTLWACILLAVYLSPYLYVAIWGRNMPWWAWAVIMALIVLTVLGLYRKISKRVKKS
jgi:hypothetical protein